MQMAFELSSLQSMPRDFHLNAKDIANIQIGYRHVQQRWGKDEHTSLRLWKEENADNVLVYTERPTAVNGDVLPFQIAVSTPEQIQLMVKYGKGRPFLLDSTSGTNSHRVSKITCSPLMHKTCSVKLCC